MARTFHFTDPSNTPAALEQMKADNEEIQLELSLLQPLSNPPVLSACRDPESRYARDPAGNKCGLTNNEYLNLGTLSKSWRQQLVPFIRQIQNPLTLVTFDAALPQYGLKENVERRIKWDVQANYRGDPIETVDLNVEAQALMNLAITLATEVRMLRGPGTRFKVRDDSISHWRDKTQRTFHEQVERLSS